jgi:hypothetical protein
MIFFITTLIVTTVSTGAYAALQLSKQNVAQAQAKQAAEAGASSTYKDLASGAYSDPTNLLTTTGHTPTTDNTPTGTWSIPNFPAVSVDSTTESLTLKIVGKSKDGTQTHALSITYSWSTNAASSTVTGILGQGITINGDVLQGQGSQPPLSASGDIVTTGNVECGGWSQNSVRNIIVAGNVTIKNDCDITGYIWSGGNVTADTSLSNVNIAKGVYAKGSISIESGTVGGDIIANSDIDLTGNDYTTHSCTDNTAATVCGNVISVTGDVSLASGTHPFISGSVYSDKDVTFAGNNNTDGGLISGNVVANGNVTFTRARTDGNIYSGKSTVLDQSNVTQSIYANTTVTFQNYLPTVSQNVYASTEFRLNSSTSSISGSLTVVNGDFTTSDASNGIKDIQNIVSSGTIASSSWQTYEKTGWNGSPSVTFSEKRSDLQMPDWPDFASMFDKTFTDKQESTQQTDGIHHVKAPSPLGLMQISSSESSIESWTTDAQKWSDANHSDSTAVSWRRYIFSNTINGVSSCTRAENFLKSENWGTDASGSSVRTLVEVYNCGRQLSISDTLPNISSSDQWNLILKGDLVVMSDSGFRVNGDVTSPNNQYSMYLIVPSDAHYSDGNNVLPRSVAGSTTTDSSGTVISDGTSQTASGSSYVTLTSDGVPSCSRPTSNSTYGNISVGASNLLTVSTPIFLYTPCSVERYEVGGWPFGSGFTMTGMIGAGSFGNRGWDTWTINYQDMFLPWDSSNTNRGPGSTDGTNQSDGDDTDSVPKIMVVKRVEGDD